ncbi:unnamed protein product [Paramecium sonneborni]|uniref:Transmembrane protein n=1 Tax=Paramecium sonneborni TaxID=65129 RepID=A0A8S1RGP3_9CILI|nr:unnamed protein product [Paramecium sonneborni]
MILIFFLSCWFLITLQTLSNTALNQSNLIAKKLVELSNNEIQDQSCLTFGIWSKYNPLSNSKLKGSYGLFDSNCFQLMNAVDDVTFSLHLIYYDCLDYPKRQITKYIRLGLVENQQYIFQKKIEHTNYENIWYFFQVISIQSQNQLEFAIYSSSDLIFQETADVKLNDKNLQLLFTFGGSLKVNLTKITLIKQGTIFSLFQGLIIVQNIEMQRLPIYLDFGQMITEFYQNIVACTCKSNLEIKIDDYHLIYLDQQIQVSENNNCDSYSLTGWFLITNISQSSQEFIYQFIKISSNQNDLQNENIATFQLFYLISPIQNKLIITTYKYDFPSVTLNFSNNQFLIIREFLIQSNIKSWQYLQVKLEENVLNFQITFYNTNSTQSYDTKIEIKQFHNCQFQILYGNIQQDKSNYLNIIVKSLRFDNCNIDQTNNKCHYSCSECDGPGYSNCLVCPENSNRIYQKQFKQCVCPYSSIDQNTKCINFLDQKLNILRNQSNIVKCQQGFFEINGDCIRCPSRIKEKLITCSNCFENAKTWNKFAKCDRDLYINDDFKTYDPYIYYEALMFLFDGSELIIFQNSKDQGYFNMVDEIVLYEEFIQMNQNFKQFCNQKNENVNVDKFGYLCKISNCKICGIQINEQICLICDQPFKLINGQCTFQINYFNNTKCFPPFYTSHTENCELCKLKNCIYCFEYVNNYYQWISINRDQINLSANQQNDVKIGCLLCEEGFSFDFTLGFCVNNFPSIQNCLTAFINFESEEICLSSSLDNFLVSKEINHCEQFILNCQSCYLDLYKFIKCIECKLGFVLQEEQCYENQEQSSTYLKMFWDMKIEIFLMSFQNNDYIENLNQDQFLFCKNQIQDGEYYCDQCICKYQETQIHQNEFFQQCSQLCQVCKLRENEEIKKIAPNFQKNLKNSIYTSLCIKPQIDPFIYYNPYLKTTQYCENGDCNNAFKYEIIQTNCFYDNFSKDLNSLGIIPEYLNKIGANNLTIIIKLVIQNQKCNLIPLFTKASLKLDVFTLQFINMQFLGEYPIDLYVFDSFFIQDYDSFTMINFGLVFPNFNMLNFNFSNSDKEFNIKLINITIKDSLIRNVGSLFTTEQFGSIDLQNLSIINSKFINSSLFNFNYLSLNGFIKIQSLNFINCTFINLNLFQFSQIYFIIHINNLTLDQCQLHNASIYNFQNNSGLQTQLLLINTQIFRSKFESSKFFYCSSEINVTVNNIIFQFNYLFNSLIFGFSSHLQLKNLEILDNIFLQSSFMSSIQMISQNIILLSIKDLLIRKNQIQNSNLFTIFSTFKSKEITINFEKVIIELNTSGLQTNNKTNQISYLFYINCKKIVLSNLEVNDNLNLHILYFYDTADIKLEKISFQNSVIKQKVSIQSSYLSNQNLQNQLLKIVGFQKILIQNCKIQLISSIDESIIKIMSNAQYVSGQIEIINLLNLEFYGNLLQSFNSGAFFSLITIESDKILEIDTENFLFHRNIMHVYSESSLKGLAALLFISSPSSTIYFKNFSCQQNAMTNSSNSFINIATKSLNISNLHVSNHNVLPLNVWNNYYEIQLVNQEQTNSLFMQIFNLKTIGGVASIQAANFICINTTFENILAVKSSIFDILTTHKGIIRILNISVRQISNSMKKIIESTGCISINSQNSLLNILIQNVTFQDIFNRMASALFTINPSLLQNLIILQDIRIINCISLKNQIVKIQFMFQINKQNSVIFKNLFIVQDQESWINLFLQIGLLSQSEIREIASNSNSLIQLENCEFIIMGLIVEGMLFSKVIQLSNINNLIIFTVRFITQRVFTHKVLFIQVQQHNKNVLLLQNRQYFIIVQ